jgi:hypothetical protein
MEPFRADDGGEVRVQDLDGDVPLVLDVARQVDGGHATAADLATYLMLMRK